MKIFSCDQKAYKFYNLIHIVPYKFSITITLKTIVNAVTIIYIYIFISFNYNEIHPNCRNLQNIL